MKITINPFAVLGGLLAWHWFGFHMLIVLVLVTSKLTLEDDSDFGFIITLW
jgi:hypothetical protein